jgi:hypothetical protein
LNTEFGFVNLNERGNFGDIAEYNKLGQILKLILLKWVVNISFADLLLGFCVHCNQTYNSIKTITEYNLVKKYPVTCS